MKWRTRFVLWTVGLVIAWTPIAWSYGNLPRPYDQNEFGIILAIVFVGLGFFAAGMWGLGSQGKNQNP